MKRPRKYFKAEIMKKVRDVNRRVFGHKPGYRKQLSTMSIRVPIGVLQIVEGRARLQRTTVSKIVEDLIIVYVRRRS